MIAAFSNRIIVCKFNSTTFFLDLGDGAKQCYSHMDKYANQNVLFVSFQEVFAFVERVAKVNCLLQKSLKVLLNEF